MVRLYGHTYTDVRCTRCNRLWAAGATAPWDWTCQRCGRRHLLIPLAEPEHDDATLKERYRDG